MKFESPHPDQHFGNRTYSQHGDDIMILNMFKQMNLFRPSYLDLGAHHPTVISNTKLLYDRGSGGVNVEANPSLMFAFKEERPRDKNLNLGVHLQKGSEIFLIFETHSGRNTFSRDEADRHTKEEHRHIKSEIRVEVKTLNQIVDDHCNGVFPDFLNCDIEGLDYEVLKSANFHASKPKVICVETRYGQSKEMCMMMRYQGYDPYCRCGENILFYDSYIKELHL